MNSTRILTSNEIRDIVAETALNSLRQVEVPLMAAGIDVEMLALAIGGNSAMVLAVSLGLDGED